MNDINETLVKLYGKQKTHFFGAKTPTTATFNIVARDAIKFSRFYESVLIGKLFPYKPKATFTISGSGRKRKSNQQLLSDNVEYKKGTKKLMKREKDIQKTKNFATEIGNAVSTSVKRGTTRLSPADLNAIINQILSS